MHPLPDPTRLPAATYTLEAVKSQRGQISAAPTPSALTDAKLGEWESAVDTLTGSVRRYWVVYSAVFCLWRCSRECLRT